MGTWALYLLSARTSFLDIPLISRYPTHFSISHSFLDIFVYWVLHIGLGERLGCQGVARVDDGRVPMTG
jgi:hypothetical protein